MVCLVLPSPLTITVALVGDSKLTLVDSSFWSLLLPFNLFHARDYRRTRARDLFLGRAHGAVFLVDAADSSRFAEVKEEFDV